MFQSSGLSRDRLTKEATGYKAVLTNPVVLTVVTVYSASSAWPDRYSKIWPLFGASNQLLAAIGLLAVATWLGKVGKNNKMFLFPMVFMLIVTITSLYRPIANFKGLAQVCHRLVRSSIVLAGLLVILALILAFDGFKTLANQKKQNNVITKRLPDKRGFCDRFLCLRHIRYNDRKLFQRKENGYEKLYLQQENAGKMKEIREILADLPVEIYSMKEAGISVEIDENGKTFEENAKSKHRPLPDAQTATRSCWRMTPVWKWMP